MGLNLAIFEIIHVLLSNKIPGYFFCLAKIEDASFGSSQRRETRKVHTNSFHTEKLPMTVFSCLKFVEDGLLILSGLDLVNNKDN